jgi:nucleoside-diphosphate-sugar epimerase
MTVAITGASGFIGSSLLRALDVCGGVRIRILSREKSRALSRGVEILKGDLTAGDCPLKALVAGCRVVFHCAGQVRDIFTMRALHVDGTRRLLDAAEAEGARVKQPLHWVQLSSVGAYGPPLRARDERVVTEGTPTRPVGEYERTKMESDELVMAAAASGAITCSILRPSNVIGVGMPNGSLRALGAMVRKGLFFYVGRPGAVATYVHVDDVVTVLRLCGSDDRAKGKVFNVSNDCLLEELVARIASDLGVKCPRVRLPEMPVRLITWAATKVTCHPLTQARIDALVSRTRYPYARLERELGFRPQICVLDAIGEIVRE